MHKKDKQLPIVAADVCFFGQTFSAQYVRLLYNIYRESCSLKLKLECGIRKHPRDQRALLLLTTTSGKIIKISFQITLPENTTHIVICTAGGSATQSVDTKREVIKTVVKAGNNNQGKYGSLAC